MNAHKKMRNSEFEDRNNPNVVNPKSRIRNPKSPFTVPAKAGTTNDRQGSILIVVIGLLLLLMLLGFTFFTFSNQEHSSALYFAESTKVFNVTTNSDALFDFALEQLIIGPWDNNQQSVLWPGKHSLVPNMLGMFNTNKNGQNNPTQPSDRHAFNGGPGIIVGANSSNGAPQFASGTYQWVLNFSPAAVGAPSQPAPGSGWSRQFIQNTNNFPAIDVGYTYPDINNVFLAHIGSDPSGNLIITPSFHRPQYLRQANGAPFNNWYDASAPIDTTCRLLRPHPSHVCVFDGVTPRFLSAAVTVPSSSPPHVIQYFGYPAVDTSGNPVPFGLDANKNKVFGESGVWTNSGANFDWDADNDGDGIPDGIWVDLNFPWYTLSDGRKVVPLFSYTVVEADSLINVNLASDLSGFVNLAQPVSGATLQYPSSNSNATPISRSNYGMSPGEINMFWALTADPMNTNATYLTPLANTAANGPNAKLAQYRAFFGRSNQNSNSYVFDRVEAANMDMLFLMWGRPNYSVTTGGSGQEVFSINDLNAGRYGETPLLLSGANTGNPGSSPPNSPSSFPRAGQSNVDDDGDALAGVTDAYDLTMYQWLVPVSASNPWPNNRGTFLFPQIPPPASYSSSLQLTSTVPSFGRPSDYTGVGQWTAFSAGFGMKPQLYPASGTGRFLQYTGFQFGLPNTSYEDSTGYAIPNIRYDTALGGSLAQGLSALNISSPIVDPSQGIYDESDELVNIRQYAQNSDQMFTADEMPGLHLSDNDYGSGLVSSRLRQLASLNFDLNQQAASIRKKFTTDSWDRPQHGFAYDPNFRTWEYNDGNWDGSTQPQFPPMVFGNSMDGNTPVSVDTSTSTTTSEPFRMALAALIGARLNNALYFANGNNNNPNAFNTPPYDSRTTQANMSPWQQQLRLNINRVLTTANPSQAFGTTNSVNNPLRYRALTPHPTMTQWLNWKQLGNNPTAQIPGSSTGSFVTDSYNFSSDPRLQEYWARRDRQQFARDIYVMLYMFGGGLDSEDLNGNGTLDAGEDLNANGTLDTYVDYARTPNTITTADGTDPDSILNLRKLYSDRQLQEMAQFAVNMVDALDRDDTITAFEYDRNLADGWNLDDDALSQTPDPIVSTNPNDRGVVYGVEMQELAFSEVQVVVSRTVFKYDSVTGKYGSAAPGVDHTSTQLDDSQRDRYFTYIELYNVSPYPVPVNNQNWQVALLNPGASPTLVNPSTSLANFQTMVILNDYNNKTVASMTPYTIGSRTNISTDPMNGTACLPSLLMVDPMGSTNYSQIVPPPGTSLNLDLVSQAFNVVNGVTVGTPSASNQPFFLIKGDNSTDKTAGDFVDMGVNITTGGFISTTPNPFTTTFVLRRRLNLNRPAPDPSNGTYSGDDADNPWIEVDRMTNWNTKPSDDPQGQTASTIKGAATTGLSPAGWFFGLRDPADSNITFGGGTIATNDIQPKLPRPSSRERLQPLDGFELPPGGSTLQTNVAFYTPSAYVTDSLGKVNSNTSSYLGGSFTLWQPTFDRDFSSVMELLSLPLYSPSVLTQKLSITPTSSPPQAPQMVPELVTPLVSSLSAYEARVAQAKFFRPQHPLNAGQAVSAQTLRLDNRWYRVLELLEVPSRANMQVENLLLTNFPWLSPRAVQRVAAKMNVNGLRYAENLFALLDDPNQFDYTALGYNLTDGSYVDRLENTRNWWLEFLKARDGKDPQTNLYLPGTGVSRPFRSFSFLDNNPNTTSLNPIDDTLLRSLVLDNAVGLSQRRLFEARTQNDLATGSAVGKNNIDYYTRQRLLSKISNNTTNRSNVFIVWISVGFFEAYQNLAADPTGNVIQIGAKMTDQTDRRGFFIVDRTLLEDAYNQQTGTFDFHKFIQYRKTIQ